MSKYVAIHTTLEGKQCPSCGSMENAVIGNRYKSQFNETIRKRECKVCGTRWLTKEITVAVRKE